MTLVFVLIDWHVTINGNKSRVWVLDFSLSLTYLQIPSILLSYTQTKYYMVSQIHYDSF
jgi:hypothetical protein